MAALFFLLLGGLILLVAAARIWMHTSPHTLKERTGTTTQVRWKALRQPASGLMMQNLGHHGRGKRGFGPVVRDGYSPDWIVSQTTRTSLKSGDCYHG